jgi:hypothetical protein
VWAQALIVALLVAAVAWPVREPAPGAPGSEELRSVYAGWAMEAYPELKAAEMEAMVRRTVQAGANVVWIGHNNPGEVEAGKVEPGLSYAVYEAALDPADPRHDAAVPMIEAQRRLLDACRAAGVKAVLPVGYQIQMGRDWNESHPEALRRDAQGRLLDIFGGGVSASFYAPAYRRDIEAYYRWVDAQLVRPYADVLLMLNLADEPIGGDYSAAAEAEFRRQTGLRFADVDSPARQRRLGEFQSRYVAEYAAWSARLWQTINPDIPVTLSFDGAQARMTYTLPDVEALFRDTPSNFVVTFDAYPRDGLPNVALSEGDLTGLFLLARSAGLYSARYHKPLWLWAAAHRWGLSGSSPDPGTVSDAVANGLALALLAGQAGGDVRGIVYWNLNVKEQGLYNDVQPVAYDVETMFERVSAGLARLRGLLHSTAVARRPDVLVLAPPAIAYERIGASREPVRLEEQPFSRLGVLASQDVSAAVVAGLQGWPLDGVRAIAVISPATAYLPPGDLERLRAFLAAGGRVVASRGVAPALGDVSGEPEQRYGELARRWGRLSVAQQGVPALFEEQNAAVLAGPDGFWQDTLGLAVLQPGYRVIAGRTLLVYNRGPEPATIQLRLPFLAAGLRYPAQSLPAEALFGPSPAVTLARREYALLSAVQVLTTPAPH